MNAFIQSRPVFFSLPLAQNPNAIDYILPDYNEVKQGYVQPIAVGDSSADSTRKNATKQQQQVCSPVV